MDRTVVSRTSCSIVIFLVLSCIFPVTSAVHLSVVRLQGSGEGNQHSVIESVPAASLLQTPGARADATTWCDESGHVWLFGGEGYDHSTSNQQPKLLNDLWMFNTSRLEWNLVHSGKVQTRKNGTDVVPEPRRRASSCGVPGIVFVIFGGIDSKGSSLSDTWILSIPKGRWVPFSDTAVKDVHPPSNWSAVTSWCHEDALYVVGGSKNDVNMWKFSLKSLEWTDETQFLSDRQHHIDVLLSRPQRPEINVVTTVWNGSFYLYDWQIGRDGDSDSLILSVDLQRLLSIPFTYYINNRWSTPFLWSHLNSVHKGNVTCSSSPESPQMPACNPGNGLSCSLRVCYKIISSSGPEQKAHSSSWFYADKMYIFGGQAVSSDGTKTFSSDLWSMRQSYENNFSTGELVISLFSALLAFILLGFGLFCLIRYCDYQLGPMKPHELKIHYTRLRDENIYD